MFDQILLSPQVKQTVIISNKHGIYELPHKLPNEIRKLGNIRKISKLHTIIPKCSSLPFKINILSILAKKSSKIEIELFL